MKQELFVQLPSLQFFAAGNNNDKRVRYFEKEFKGIFGSVFDKKSYFHDFSPSGVDILDGVQENADAFYLKTTDIPVTVGQYNTGANVGMGTGTANSSRFGQMVEIIYTNTPVPYLGTWSYHEGIDRFTVNNNFEVAIAERLELQAQAKTQLLDGVIANYLVTNAGKAETLASYSDADITALFDRLAAYYVNIEAIGSKVAKVNTALYNAIVKHPLATTYKNSDVNIDSNTIVEFRGFLIDQVPDAKLPTGNAAVTYIKGIGKPYVGISTSRTIESHDFDGVALQGAGKYGAFVILDNRKAIAKIAAPTP